MVKIVSQFAWSVIVIESGRDLEWSCYSVYGSPHITLLNRQASLLAQLVMTMGSWKNQDDACFQ